VIEITRPEESKASYRFCVRSQLFATPSNDCEEIIHEGNLPYADEYAIGFTAQSPGVAVRQRGILDRSSNLLG
jgi:hypothetical protein